jgi:hypothetical protein
VDKIIRRGAGNPTLAVPEDAEIADVLPLAFRPEGVVLRIEGAFGDHRLIP